MRSSRLAISDRSSCPRRSRWCSRNTAASEFAISADSSALPPVVVKVTSPLWASLVTCTLRRIRSRLASPISIRSRSAIKMGSVWVTATSAGNARCGSWKSSPGKPSYRSEVLASYVCCMTNLPMTTPITPPTAAAIRSHHLPRRTARSTRRQSTGYPGRDGLFSSSSRSISRPLIAVLLEIAAMVLEHSS